MIQIKVAYATPKKQIEIPLIVEESCTIAMAIRRSGILTQFPNIDLAKVAVGIHGKKAKLDDILFDGDRVEIYRPLLMDPKQARLLRAKKSALK